MILAHMNSFPSHGWERYWYNPCVARIGIVFAIFIAILEVLLRLFFAVHFRQAELILFPDRLWYHYYPAIRPKAPTSGPKIKIAFLGASVLEGGNGFGSVAESLLNALSRRAIHAQIFNYATRAHTSLDAYYKYLHSKDGLFDFVIVYEGFNEVRANLCPNEVFHRDYTHLGWYRRINLLNDHPELRWVTIPFGMEFLWREINHKINPAAEIPLHHPKSEWLSYGEEIKTEGSLAHNLSQILKLATQRRETVILITQAYWIPPNYSLDKFQKKSLDYGNHLYPVELWGTPSTVSKSIARHNDVIRKTQLKHPETLLIDIERLMPSGKRYFNDVCHLTTEGSQVLSNAIVDTLLRMQRI